MDTEKSGEVLDALEAQQPEETTTLETEVVSKAETPGESAQPENPPAAAEEPEQLALNGHDTDVVKREEAIVVENVTSSEEYAAGDGLPAPGATPEPSESTEKISDPAAAAAAAAFDIEPETITPEQQPLPEKAPESLAQSPHEAEPVEPAEAVPEPVPQPPSPEETVPEKVESKEEEPPTVDTAKETTKAQEAEKISAEPSKEEVQEQKPAEMEKVVAAAEVDVPAQKPVEEKLIEVETVTGAEAAAAEPEPEKEEDVAPAAGSLSFPLLEREQTKDALRTSRTLVVLRGLPGSGKSFLARAIADAYKDQCSVICADDHGVKPEDPQSSADGYKALDAAVVGCCGAGSSSPVMIVVDDTNHSQDRLARMGEIAREHHLVVLFLQPQTAWCCDAAELSKKSKRGLEEATLDGMKASFEEMIIPLYFGWFLLSPVQDKVKCTAMDFLKTLDTLEAFKKHMSDFTAKPDKEVDLEEYYKSKGVLHCTTKFCDYGKEEGAKEYTMLPAVKDSYGSTFELALTALFVTPRTVGAQVSLTEEQLPLWPTDAESSVPATSSLLPGSRAHVTLGCAEGVEPVQTGLDLLDILVLQQEGQKGEETEEMELGSLAYYGEGRWFLSLREPICTPACFSSFYKGKVQEAGKKEPEKKKTRKCTVL